RWIPIAHLNTARHWCAAATAANTVFVSGGHDGEKDFDDVEQFDKSANKWTRIEARMTEPRSHLAVASIDNSVILVGGAVVRTWSDVVERFNAVEKRFSTIDPSPVFAVAPAVASVEVSSGALARLIVSGQTAKRQSGSNRA